MVVIVSISRPLFWKIGAILYKAKNREEYVSHKKAARESVLNNNFSSSRTSALLCCSTITFYRLIHYMGLILSYKS